MMDILMTRVEERVVQLLLQERTAAPTIINQTNNTYIAQQNTFVVNDLRHENLDGFDDARLRFLISQTRQGFIEFVKDTRLNPEKPQNRNVRIVSKKQNLAAVKKAGEWQQGSIAQSLEDVLDASKAQFLKPLSNPDYMEHLLENEAPVMAWCQKVMAKKACEWRPIKNTVRAQLDRVYKEELLQIGKVNRTGVLRGHLGASPSRS